jgi:hypothetical protein
VTSYEDLDQKTIKDAYIEWVDLKNQEMYQEYLTHTQLYLLQCNIIAAAQTKAVEIPKPPEEPNYFLFDTEAYKNYILKSDVN